MKLNRLIESVNEEWEDLEESEELETEQREPQPEPVVENNENLLNIGNNILNSNFYTDQGKLWRERLTIEKSDNFFAILLNEKAI